MDHLLENLPSDEKLAYEALVKEKNKYSSNADFMWKLAKFTHEYGVVIRSKDGPNEAKKLFFDASDYGEAAVELDHSNGNAHKWYAVALASVRDYLLTEDRIFKGHMIKMHCDQAMATESVDPILIHLQGRWRYEISMFTPEENNMAARMFCIPPYSTFDEAESLLLKAMELNPDWKENLLYLAKTYIAKNEMDKAKETISKAVALSIKDNNDIFLHEQLLTVQKTLANSK